MCGPRKCVQNTHFVNTEIFRLQRGTELLVYYKVSIVLAYRATPLKWPPVGSAEAGKLEGIVNLIGGISPNQSLNH